MIGIIYLIRNKDLYKIGVTRNFKQRMKVLKPDQILKVLKIDGYKELEKRLHKRYKNERIPQTEYFRLNKSQIKNCKKELSIFHYRRSKCNPLLIGLICACVSPILCVFWAIRQRSLILGIIALLTILITSNFFFPSIKFNHSNKAFYNSFTGIIAFIISRKNKNHSLK